MSDPGLSPSLTESVPKPDEALFAWEGFAFHHPVDWAPATLSGDRRAGYVRLESPGRLGCQVRWQHVKTDADLGKLLDNYFHLLERDARRAKSVFSVEREVKVGRHVFRHVGANQGRGMAIAGPCARVFLVEVMGGRSDSLMPPYRQITDSFHFAPPGGLEKWCLLGLCASLPSGLSPVAKALHAGKTFLSFHPKGARIELVRYAFGKELLDRHGLEPWSRAALRLPKAKAHLEHGGIHLEDRGGLFHVPVRALARLDRERNQLLAIRSASRDSKWLPTWDWLD